MNLDTRTNNEKERGKYLKINNKIEENPMSNAEEMSNSDSTEYLTNDVPRSPPKSEMKHRHKKITSNSNDSHNIYHMVYSWNTTRSL